MILLKRCVVIDYQSGRLSVGDFVWATFFLVSLTTFRKCLLQLQIESDPPD